jgi:beta-1,4-mannosyl-glycoprotein beta-1,4-N-acetylglucosaminyltransferase
LRNLKFKKYPFWRIDKPKNLQIIENGGWHFAYLQSPENIKKKIKSFAHGEFNKVNFTDEKTIEEKIKMKKDIFDRNISYKKVPLDDSFPKYIIDNKEKFAQWII